MKKVKFEGKLKGLNKETVSKLNQEHMSKINGGGTILTTWYNCNPKPPANTIVGAGCATIAVSCDGCTQTTNSQAVTAACAGC